MFDYGQSRRRGDKGKGRRRVQSNKGQKQAGIYQNQSHLYQNADFNCEGGREEEGRDGRATETHLRYPSLPQQRLIERFSPAFFFK